MNITGASTTNSVAPLNIVSSAQKSQTTSASDSDGDGDVHGSGRKSHGHGQLQSALLQALQNLGLAPVSQTSGAATAVSSPATTSTGTDSDGDNDASASNGGNVKNDLKQFTRALFQAIKGENATGAPTTSGNATETKSNFASGLSALITQVSNGTAPTDLQNAFSNLVADLQSSSDSTGTTNTSSSKSTPSVNLQQLLTQLQQNVGYGSTGSNTAIGNLLSAKG